MACVQIYFYFLDSQRFLEGYLLLYFIILDVLHMEQVCQLKCFVGFIDVDLQQFCQS